MFNILNNLYFWFTHKYLKPPKCFYTDEQYEYFPIYKVENKNTTIVYKKIFYNIQCADELLYLYNTNDCVVLCLNKLYNLFDKYYYKPTIILFPTTNDYKDSYIEYTLKDCLITIYIICDRTTNSSGKTIRELLIECGEIRE